MSKKPLHQISCLIFRLSASLREHIYKSISAPFRILIVLCLYQHGSKGKAVFLFCKFFANFFSIFLKIFFHQFCAYVRNHR